MESNTQKVICSYIDKEFGVRCKNKLGLYPIYCWLHTRRIHNLQIKKSQIPNAGNGLYTGDEGFKKGDIIFRYGFPYNKVTEKVYSAKCDLDDSGCYEYLYCDSNDKSKTKLKQEGEDCWDSLDIRSTIARNSNSAHNSKFRHMPLAIN
ncbi:hypothetical protein SAGO17_0083 [Mimivirus AB-566-O17]|uniref:Uncharacterized protein n=1 Tax=Mimivirus AB-566-O17 TaxID=1988039 RepID=A0A1X9VNU2_9VIRU|nr:hypothetical protein SAGO17_0083 [Mimivirus AB-566-O17]